MPESAPNEPGFWDQRYRSGRIAWDLGGVPQALTGFLARRHPEGRVLVPGCGSGYEIPAFHAGGWDVFGIDFSAAAVDRARRLVGPLADRILHGDFFSHPFAAGGFAVVYERTFLCSLPPALQPAYFRRMAELVRPGGVLCGFFFFGPEGEPPPYPIAPDELRRSLAGSFELLVDDAVADSLPLYAGKERWQVWRRRGAPRPGGMSANS